MRLPCSRFLLLLLFAIPEATPCQNAAPGADATISVDVNLVVLHAVVHDRKGNFVSALPEQDFRVLEDGRPQSVRVFRHEDMPVSLGLIVDNSTSMRGKRADVTAAALEFVRSSNQQDEMFIVNFNERATLGLPVERLFSASATELEKALNGVPAHGMTALYDGIMKGLTHLKSATADNKVLIVISDGGDNASRHTLGQVLDAAERSDVVIYSVGLFGDRPEDQNPGVLKKLARTTGGEAFFPVENKQVVTICQRIAADIRHQYTIAYMPSNQKLDGTYRKILVQAVRSHGGTLFVRTRDGYLAAAKEPGGSPQPSGSVR